MKKTYILAVLLAVLLVLPPMTSLSAATQAQGGEGQHNNIYHDPVQHTRPLETYHLNLFKQRGIWTRVFYGKNTFCNAL